MDFSEPPRRSPGDSLLPMINVVFLLLVFFLMAARIAPPAPFEVSPPQAVAEAEAQGMFTLFIDGDGRPGFRDITGEAAMAALAGARAEWCATAGCDPELPDLTLRADARLPASRLAALLPRLASAGYGRIELVVEGTAP